MSHPQISRRRSEPSRAGPPREPPPKKRATVRPPRKITGIARPASEPQAAQRAARPRERTAERRKVPAGGSTAGPPAWKPDPESSVGLIEGESSDGGGPQDYA